LNYLNLIQTNGLKKNKKCTVHLGRFWPLASSPAKLQVPANTAFRPTARKQGIPPPWRRDGDGRTIPSEPAVRRLGDDRWANQFWRGEESISSPEWLSMAVGLEQRVTSALGRTVRCRRRLPGRRALPHSGGAQGGGEGASWWLEAARH
jgi:hypothetical protein